MPVLRTKTSRMWLPRRPARTGAAEYAGLPCHVRLGVCVRPRKQLVQHLDPRLPCVAAIYCWSFILLSGFSFPLAKRPAKNGLIVAGYAAVLTFVTAVFMPSEAIWFGVLHLNAAAVLLTCLVYPLLQRLPGGRGPGGVCSAVCADEPAALRVFGLRELAALCVPTGLVQDELVLARSPGSDAVRIGRLLPDPSVGVPVLVRCVSGAAVAPRQGRAARRAASSVCHRAQYAAGLHAASARNLRCTGGCGTRCWGKGS